MPNVPVRRYVFVLWFSVLDFWMVTTQRASDSTFAIPRNEIREHETRQVAQPGDPEFSRASWSVTRSILAAAKSSKGTPRDSNILRSVGVKLMSVTGFIAVVPVPDESLL
jgi:hypothetical protein